jgi:hypothetical protein
MGMKVVGNPTNGSTLMGGRLVLEAVEPETLLITVRKHSNIGYLIFQK